MGWRYQNGHDTDFLGRQNISVCCTCTNNIRLVCGKCKLKEANSASTPPAKRPRHLPGYYCALYNRCSGDVLGVGTGDHNREHGKLRLRSNREGVASHPIHPPWISPCSSRSQMYLTAGSVMSSTASQVAAFFG